MVEILSHGEIYEDCSKICLKCMDFVYSLKDSQNLKETYCIERVNSITQFMESFIDHKESDYRRYLLDGRTYDIEKSQVFFLRNSQGLYSGNPFVAD